MLYRVLFLPFLTLMNLTLIKWVSFFVNGNMNTYSPYPLYAIQFEPSAKNSFLINALTEVNKHYNVHEPDSYINEFNNARFVITPANE